MNDASILGVLILGLIGGGLLGYLVGGLRRELFDRNLRHANTRLRSLELDRDLLGETLDITRRELDDLRSQTAEQELEGVRGPTKPASVSGAWPAIVARMQTLEITRRQLDELQSQTAGRDLIIVLDDKEIVVDSKKRPGNDAGIQSAKGVKTDKLPKNPSRRSPKNLPPQVEEPDPPTLPDLEYPEVRFG